MKIMRIVSTGVILAILITPTILTAQDARHARDLNVIAGEIQQSQGVDSVRAIDLNTVSPATMEELGNAVMERIIGNPERHAWMEQMMGGEGSEQLAAAHRWMGYQYIRSGGDLTTWGPDWMGFGMMSFGGMHGWYGDPRDRTWNLAGQRFHRWYWMLGPITLIAGVVLVIAIAFPVLRRH